MNRKTQIKFFLKYILPPILIIIFLDIYNYIKMGKIPQLNFELFIIFLGFFFITSFFWAMTETVQVSLENFINSNLKEKIVFILIILILIFLYKSTNKI